ncbi:hypothetical protein FRC17_001792, partial [Serendipita sp. 399]
MSRKQWTVDDMVSMKGMKAIVTGGNTGIGYLFRSPNIFVANLGYAACKGMLQHDAKIYMMSRDSQKSHDAIKRLKEETGKDTIELIPLDLSDLQSVRKAAETFL